MSESGPRWWSERYAVRGALVGAPFGALAAIVAALVVVRYDPVTALAAYLLGALVGSGVGYLLGGLVGSARRERPRSDGLAGLMGHRTA